MITINIMSYRYGHLVAHAVDSVLSQTVKPDVVRVYDDGIGDCTHVKYIYPEVELIEREKNLGVVKNFQDALERTDTNRVLFLGADNWLRQDTIEILSKEAADIVTYDIYLTGTEYKTFQPKVNVTNEEHGYPVWSVTSHHGSMLMNTDKAKEAGYSTQSKTGKETCEDKNIFEKMIRNGATHTHIPTPLLYYRRHRENFNVIK